MSGHSSPGNSETLRAVRVRHLPTLSRPMSHTQSGLKADMPDAHVAAHGGRLLFERHVRDVTGRIETPDVVGR
jgi:hypothetical protein